MVAVVGNPDVTGENRRHALTLPSSLWMNDLWGRPMADPRSHKSYRPLTVLSFSKQVKSSELAGQQKTLDRLTRVANHDDSKSLHIPFEQ
ncbi:hypothetical protein HPB49_015635 [Dermacentor silvarum]|uniref:Uncharacterized protein n=1 Tax=Dermacentor silvarum TaxID=543639 RepID=A0ACB8DJM8_DERSI|nr:hypothetical protein HPB49_015635 [Dermacentor silvarum]